MSSEVPQGIVTAVCMSPVHGYPTYPQESVLVGLDGIEGDAHAGPLRESFKNPGTLKPNDRSFCIVADEVRESLGLQPGDFNEQLLVRGLGDLGDVAIGSHVLFETGVELEVVDRAYPCLKLEAYNGIGLIKALAEKRGDELYTRRGILARVIHGGELHPGISVALINPTVQAVE